jgi:hypothetical protein
MAISPCCIWYYPSETYPGDEPCAATDSFDKNQTVVATRTELAKPKPWDGRERSSRRLLAEGDRPLTVWA